MYEYRNKIIIRLCLETGNKKHYAELFKLLEEFNVKPKSTYSKRKKGEKKKLYGSNRYGAEFFKEYKNKYYADKCILNFLKTLGFSLEQLDKIPKIKKFLTVIIYSYNDETYTCDLPALIYDSALIKALANAGVEFDHDIYFMANEDTNESSNSTKISLEIYGFNCDPSDITKIIDVNPTLTWKKGDRPSKDSIKKYKYSRWLYEITMENIKYVGYLLHKLADVFKDKADNFSKLPKEHGIKINICASLENGEQILFFDKAIVDFTHKIGAEIDFNLRNKQKEQYAK
jgi:hypothetical protein